MSKIFHAIELKKGSSNASNDSLIVGNQPNIANIAGAGAGLTVVTAVAFANLPANYSVLITPNQDATAFVSSKTANGFNVTLTPRLAANTLAAGTFDVMVLA